MNIRLIGKKGCVYFILARGTGHLKIGRTTDVTGRLRCLRRGTPHSLELLGFFPEGGVFVERDLHEKFKDFRVHHEWFLADPSILQFIAEHSTNNQALKKPLVVGTPTSTSILDEEIQALDEHDLHTASRRLKTLKKRKSFHLPTSLELAA